MARHARRRRAPNRKTNVERDGGIVVGGILRWKAGATADCFLCEETFPVTQIEALTVFIRTHRHGEKDAKLAPIGKATFCRICVGLALDGKAPFDQLRD